MGDAQQSKKPWWKGCSRRGIRNGAVISLITAAITSAATFGIARMEHSATMQRDEFVRLERLTDRLENRLDYYAERNASLYRERQVLRDDLDSLAYVVAQLQWRNYQLSRQIDALEKQIRGFGKVPSLPPQLLNLLISWQTPRKLNPVRLILYRPNPWILASSTPLLPSQTAPVP